MSSFSIRDFVEKTEEKDHGEGLFEFESERILEIKLDGKGLIAMTTHYDPMTLKVSSGKPLITDPNATVAWSGSLQPEFRTDVSFKTFVGRGSGESIQMVFDGDGFVVVQPYEEAYFQRQ